MTIVRVSRIISVASVQDTRDESEIQFQIQKSIQLLVNVKIYNWVSKVKNLISNVSSRKLGVIKF